MVTDLEALQPVDIADAVVFALDRPRRVNVSTIELTSTEHVPGGAIIGRLAR
jgi:NADP-dependent 3-hydroxy acid dehydrogenase YdfG